MASPIRYVFARDWPLKGYLVVSAGSCLAAAVHACQPSIALFKDWRYALLFLVATVVAPVLGFFLALPFASIVIGPFYHFQAWRNGAPFRPGDRVRILVGPHRDRITRVRSRWQGDSLRVELGPEEDETFNDIFSPTQLLSEPNAEPDAAPNAGPPTSAGNSRITEGPPSVS
jgi:hypothetical protein